MGAEAETAAAEKARLANLAEAEKAAADKARAIDTAEDSPTSSTSGKEVTSSTPAPPQPARPHPKTSLLEQIRQGKNLRKAPKQKKSDASAPEGAHGGLFALLDRMRKQQERLGM